jgi:hypothetical protein
VQAYLLFPWLIPNFPVPIFNPSLSLSLSVYASTPYPTLPRDRIHQMKPRLGEPRRAPSTAPPPPSSTSLSLGNSGSPPASASTWEQPQRQFPSFLGDICSGGLLGLTGSEPATAPQRPDAPPSAPPPSAPWAPPDLAWRRPLPV